MPEINTLKRKLQRLEDDKWLTQDETTELLEATEAEWLPVVTLAVRTGLRVGELQGLRWGDVDLDGERLVVHRSWSDRLRSRRTSHRQRRGSRFTASSRATTVAP